MPHVVRDRLPSNHLPLVGGLFGNTGRKIWNEPAIDLLIRISIAEQALEAIVDEQRSRVNAPRAEIHDLQGRHFSPREDVITRMRYAEIPIDPSLISSIISHGPFDVNDVKKSIARVFGQHDLRRANLQTNICFAVEPNKDGKHLNLGRIEPIPDDWATAEESIEALKAIGMGPHVDDPVAVQWRKGRHDLLYPRFLDSSDLKDVTGVQIQQAIQSLGSIVKEVRDRLGLKSHGKYLRK